TDDDLKWFESLLTIFHLVLKFFPLTNKKLTKIWGMKMKHWKFYLLKKRKEQEYFETKSKISSPKQVQELNNLQDVNSQSFDCHNQPISKPAIIW
ncbi:hypothetical protein Avbf_16121, partial [Armadillidium vulgare]